MRNFSIINLMLIFGSITALIHAQSTFLEIQKLDNNIKNIDMSSLNKITFTNTDLVLNYLTKESESIAKSDIQKMFFTKSTGITSLVSDNKVLEVFPNPAIDIITLKNIPEGVFQANIYSITGSKVKSLMMTSDQQQININNLSKGLYILKVNNQVSKFTKL